ncbi:MAG: hypothetical protein WKF89_08650 [Chitinophagaceae bacterium]
MCSSTFAQNLSGSWYGKGNALLVGSNNNYLTELIVKQKGDEVEGIFGYYFRNGYKSVFVRGAYNKKTRKLIFKKIPLTYFRSATIDGVDCMMDFYGSVIASSVQTTINGLFVSDKKYAYTCPEIKVNYTLDISETNQDSLIENSIARKIWQPLADDIVINTTPEPVANSTKVDSTSNNNRVEMENLIALFQKRETILSKEVEIASDSVRISFYDNGDIDGDTISIFLNKQPVLAKQSLTAQALNVYLKLDPSKEVNEVSMFAENLGKFPPNTALMIVNDGEHRYEVYLSSSLTQTASVRIRKKKKNL